MENREMLKGRMANFLKDNIGVHGALFEYTAAAIVDEAIRWAKRNNDGPANLRPGTLRTLRSDMRALGKIIESDRHGEQEIQDVIDAYHDIAADLGEVKKAEPEETKQYVLGPLEEALKGWYRGDDMGNDAKLVVAIEEYFGNSLTGTHQATQEFVDAMKEQAPMEKSPMPAQAVRERPEIVDYLNSELINAFSFMMAMDEDDKREMTIEIRRNADRTFDFTTRFDTALDSNRK